MKSFRLVTWAVWLGMSGVATVVAGADGLSLLRGPVRVGPFFPQTANGITWVADDRTAYHLVVGLVESNKVLMDYRPLSDAWRPLAAATDSSYYAMEWKLASATVRLRWAAEPGGRVAGILETDQAIQVALVARPSWTNFPVTYRCAPDGALVAAPAGNGPGWMARTLSPATRQAAAPGADALASALLASSPAAGQSLEGDWAGQLFTIIPAAPLRFVAGLGHDGATPLDAAGVDARLAAALRRHDESVPKDPDLAAFQVVMNTSRLYSPVLKTLAHTVSRRWCPPGEVRLFCWDSFFNGLLAAYVDLDTARDTIRAILAAATPEGYVPNVASDRSQGRPSSRSQPPVGAMAIWKMHQLAPDRAFLAEVYPKLVRWHDWWFATNPATGKPYRDGNQNGLLEWGCSSAQAQDIKWESGLDDSPMFDEMEVEPATQTMRQDAVDLSALWAMDAEYLGRMAEALGRTEEARRFQQEVVAMNRRLNELCWDEEAGRYANRYWTPRLESYRVTPEPVPAACWTTPGGAPGLQAEYFKSVKFDRALGSQTLPVLELAVAAKGKLVQQYGDAQRQMGVRWSGMLKPRQGGVYALSVQTAGRVKLWLDGKLVLSQGADTMAPALRTPPVELKAGQAYKVKVETFGRAADAIRLVWFRIPEPVPEPGIFSSRFTVTCFYPLISGAADAARARRMLQAVRDEKRFQGEYVLPTISRDDPAFPQQDYWRGKVWGPTNYLVWLGLQRYAEPALLADVAGKSGQLFMRNWNANRRCHENYLCDGTGSGDPHYTWGALLALIHHEYQVAR